LHLVGLLFNVNYEARNHEIKIHQIRVTNTLKLISFLTENTSFLYYKDKLVYSLRAKQNSLWRQNKLFSGALAKLRRASVHLSALNKPVSIGQIFTKISVWVFFFENLTRKSNFIKIWQAYFTKTPKSSYVNISLNSS